jgi:hypothetical protein
VGCCRALYFGTTTVAFHGTKSNFKVSLFFSNLCPVSVRQRLVQKEGRITVMHKATPDSRLPIISIFSTLISMGVLRGVAMDCLKFHPGLRCPTLLRPAGRQPLKRSYGRFRACPSTERAFCSRLLPLCQRVPLWAPYAVRL